MEWDCNDPHGAVAAAERRIWLYDIENAAVDKNKNDHTSYAKREISAANVEGMNKEMKVYMNKPSCLCVKYVH